MTELNDPASASRMTQLIEDGYIVRTRSLVLTSKGSQSVRWLLDKGFLSYRSCTALTGKGLSVLMACADRPIPHKQRRISIGKG
ncbi:MAG TPA: hypothetical protein VHA37_01885 [Candidatus Saccharimonadales bacterium]|nr:hypothetical protein [Candidatus Saccharimonadales bacterium]